METRITEQSSHYDHLEQMTVEQITEGELTMRACRWLWLSARPCRS